MKKSKLIEVTDHGMWVNLRIKTPVTFNITGGEACMSQLDIALDKEAHLKELKKQLNKKLNKKKV